MNHPSNSLIFPSRFLYTMIRVTDLARSVAFYQDVLGMRELRRETFSVDRFTLVFIGYGDEPSSTVLELTYNWDEHGYELGSGYGHIALEVTDIQGFCEHLRNKGVTITREPGPMAFAPDETGKREVIAFFEDPDGYKIELIENRAR